MFDKAFCLPEFQNEYGVSDNVESWGKKADLPVYDNAGGFFKTGLTSISSFSVSAGNKKYQTYFSYANTTGEKVSSNITACQNIIYLSERRLFLFDDRLKLDGSASFLRQTTKNRNPSGGFYMNSLVGLYRFPRGMDISEYKGEL